MRLRRELLHLVPALSGVFAACSGAGDGVSVAPDPAGDAAVAAPVGDGGPNTSGDAASTRAADAGADAAGADPCLTPTGGTVKRARAFEVLGIANAASSDANGGVLVVGSYSSQLGPGPTAKFGALAAPASSGADGFVVRRDAAGVESWVRAVSTSGEEAALAVSSDPADASGDAFVAGSTTSDSLTIGATTLTRPFGTLGWLARFAGADGAPSWARAIVFGTTGGSGQFGRCDALVARGGKLFAGCRANVSLTYVDANQQTRQLSSPSGTTTYVLRLDPATGNVVWATSITSTGNGASGEIDVNAQGEVVVTGRFEGTTVKDLGNGCSAGRFGLGRNVFLARLDGQTGACSGMVSHGEQAGAAGTGALGATGSAPGRALVAGTFQTSFAIGGTNLTTVGAPSGFNAYVASFDTASSTVATWVRSLPVTMVGAAIDGCGRPTAAVETTGDVTIDGKTLSSGLHVLGLAPATGALTWSRGILGDVNAIEVRGSRLSFGPKGSLLLVGRFSGKRDLGDGTPVGLALSNFTQPFLVEYAP
jgi:hypothetical protein